MKHSTITKNDIKVLGRVVSITSAGVVASAEQIWDDKFDIANGLTPQANHNIGSGANQYDINRLFANKMLALSELFDTDESGNIVFNNNVKFNNGIDVSGNSHFDGDVELTSGHDLTAPNGQFENIHVHFATDTNTIDVESDARIGGNLNLTGNAVIGGLITANDGANLRGDLNLNGYRILNALSFAVDNATIRNTLTAKNIDVEKNISADHIEANSANFADKINVGDGQSNFEGFVYIQGADEGHPLLDGDPNVNHGLKVEGDTLIDGMIDVGEFHPHTHATTERYGVVRLASSPGDNDDDDVITTNILKLLAKVSSTISWEFGDNFNEGDMLYFDGDKWTIMNIGNIIKKWSYWMISGTNLVPNTTNTGGIVDVKTTGAIYSGK